MAIKVALAGATGNLGPAILQALLDAGFEVTILTRKGSKSTDSLAKHANQRVVEVDYDDVKSLTSAIQGSEVLVSTLTTLAVPSQKNLVDACVAAGVKRYLPSEFGCDLSLPANRRLPVYSGKVQAQAYVEEVAKSTPSFTYTYFYNNLFFDWGLQVGFIINTREHKATLFDGGDVPTSMTTLATVGKGVVGVINNLDATKNRAVLVHDGVFTQKELIELVKGVDGKEWDTEDKSTAEAEQWAYGELAKPDGNMQGAMFSFISRAALGRDHQPDFSGKTDNKLLGLKELTREQVVEVLKRYL